MNDWASGYVSDIGYTYGYYTELNPLRSKLALLNSGVIAPDFETACELGFGQGVSTNIHAASTECAWYGTDFNPSQAGFAQELARASNNNASLYDEAFSEFCYRTDLPDFDFIGLHGIWSWISDENRKVIIDFIRRKLKVGGILYISYNTMPGWAAFAPMRKLMTQHAEVIGSEGRGIVNRIDGALEFTEQLLKTNPQFLQANPQIGERINKLSDQNRHYLAHEYFNRDWHPMHFSEMLNSLESAKVGYASSANYIDQIEGINYTEDQRTFIQTVPDAMLRESVKDFMTNAQFRKDYWIKGVRKQSLFDQTNRFKDESIILCTKKETVPLTVPCALGEANLAANVYNVVLDSIGDYKEHKIGDVFESVKSEIKTFPQLAEVIITLAHSGHINTVQKNPSVRCVESSQSLNSHIMNLSKSTSDQAFLASAVTGGGIPVSRLEQLYLLATKSGNQSAQEISEFVWEILEAQNQRVLKEGKTIEGIEENKGELRSQIDTFLEDRLEILQNLKVV